MTAINPIGTIYDNKMPTVIVYNGLRGARGLVGPTGDEGNQGDSIIMRGQWGMGLTYAPLDGVTWRSSTLNGLSSLYIQNSNIPQSISTIEPQEDPSRWAEVGLTTSEGLLGGVWLVSQASHPFTRIGQPAALTATGYQLAISSVPSQLGIALVREIVDKDTFILQSTGGIADVDPAVSINGYFTDGGLYYVAANAGYLSLSPPSGNSQVVNPIYLAGTPQGVILPWTPSITETKTVNVASNRERFYYVATLGQTDFTGPDLNGNTPQFLNASLVDCFFNGLNLIEAEQYDILDVNTLQLVTPAIGGESVEVWVSEAFPITPSSTTKVDPLNFDGIARVFALEISAAPVPYQPASGFAVFLDGNPQNPDVDFTILDVAGEAQIEFVFAPEVNTNSWIIRSTG